MGAAVVDAGPLYAYVDADDTHHAASLELRYGAANQPTTRNSPTP